ncbi:MAG: DUF4869 domain-containing protein [Firmicutes bacterium]|nr:DUF4869 domain-containing protein [Bacillota bacterium]
MLKIYFGTHPNEIYNTEVYYQNQYEKEWFKDEFVQRMIADIDDSQVISADIIHNNIFGSFPSTELSTGVKTLILIYELPKLMFNISNCGDNCAKYLLEMSKDRDIKVCLHHAMNFGSNFAVKVINDRRRKVISDQVEFLMLAHQYLRGEQNEG